MGLTISHDAFDGAYSAFNRFRQAVAQAVGGSFPPHAPGSQDKYPSAEHWYYDDEHPGRFSPATHPGLLAFFNHSDCDGEIPLRLCPALADELDVVLPLIVSHDDGGAGHILRDGGYAAVTARFIKGCRRAAAEGQPLMFR